MDLVENPEEVEEKRKEISGSARLRRVLGILVFFCAFFTISFSVLYLAVFLGNLSISSPISLPSQCKIVSSSKLIHLLDEFAGGFCFWSVDNFFFAEFCWWVFAFWNLGGCSEMEGSLIRIRISYLSVTLVVFLVSCMAQKF